MKFIELTEESGLKVLVNATDIQTISERERGCYIVFRNGQIYVDETFEQIKILISKVSFIAS